MNTGQRYLKIVDIANGGLSPGIYNTDSTIRLKDDWGVKLLSGTHSFVDLPANVRVYGNKVLLCNGGDETSPVLCSVLDTNLNYEKPVGKKGTDLTVGEYRTATDFMWDGEFDKYYIAASDDNIVHVYSENTQEYMYSLGDTSPPPGNAGASGTAGTMTSQLTNPVAVGRGIARVYVLCNKGTPVGATGTGFVAQYTTDGNFIGIPLFHGKNNGNGRISQGEIKDPKDMYVTNSGGRDLIYILNGTGEIGVFEGDTMDLKEVYNIPSNYPNSNLGLTRITVDANYLYITAANVGQVIAIDLKTKELVGSFGTLRSETEADAKHTLGYFNGLGGVAVLEDRLIVTESLNDRVHTFGLDFLTNPQFTVTFHPVRLSVGSTLVDITYSLTGDALADIVLVDLGNNQEYDIKTAIARHLDYFAVRLKLDPTQFSRKKDTFEIYPIYILMED
jgi:hypothetical protein